MIITLEKCAFDNSAFTSVIVDLQIYLNIFCNVVSDVLLD